MSEADREQPVKAAADRGAEGKVGNAPSVGLLSLTGYFLKLGTLGFGGPALLGYMQRDLQGGKRWITRDEYQDGLAIAQTMPGPVAAQLAMWIGLIRQGVLGATAAGLAFVLPACLLVVGIGFAYVTFEGLPQIRALSYGIGPAIVAFIALSAWRLTRSTDGRDARLWICSAVVMAATVWGRVDLFWLVILAGVFGILVYAPPWRRAGGKAGAATPTLAIPIAAKHLPALTAAIPIGGTLIVLTLFFLKAAVLNFSGLAIVPFMHAGVVIEHRWLTERQFADAVAIGLITPGPSVIAMSTFVGYLVGGLSGAGLAMLALSAPVWVFNVAVGRFFLRHRNNAQLRGFVKGVSAAAVGAIAGAAVLLGRGAITDVWTGVILVAALAALYSRRVREPYVVALAGLAGLLLFRG